jgi:Hemerythrin HHE cation binding domain
VRNHVHQIVHLNHSKANTMFNTTSQFNHDAITLLIEEHRYFEIQLASYNLLSIVEHQKKKKLIDSLSLDLMRHMEMEEKFFYPEVTTHLKSLVQDINQRLSEHIRLKYLLRQLSGMNGNDLLFDSTVAQLAQCIKHHALEQEADMFPRIQLLSIDLVGLAGEMQSGSHGNLVESRLA